MGVYLKIVLMVEGNSACSPATKDSVSCSILTLPDDLYVKQYRQTDSNTQGDIHTYTDIPMWQDERQTQYQGHIEQHRMQLLRLETL